MGSRWICHDSQPHPNLQFLLSRKMHGYFLILVVQLHQQRLCIFIYWNYLLLDSRGDGLSNKNGSELYQILSWGSLRFEIMHRLHFLQCAPKAHKRNPFGLYTCQQKLQYIFNFKCVSTPKKLPNTFLTMSVFANKV